MELYNNSIIIFDRGYYSEDMFRELYFYRWPVELKYKELKSRFAMEEFSGLLQYQYRGILYKYASIESGFPYKK